MTSADALEGEHLHENDLSWRHTSAVSQPSLESAQQLANASKRRRSIPIRKGFIRSLTGDGAPPLRRIYKGRSGEVALKLYLALMWRSSAKPFTTDRPYSAWARLLDLDDPPGSGSRQIRNALRALERANLIALEPRPGKAPIVTILNELGGGEVYDPPHSRWTSATKNKRSKATKDKHRYFQIPEHLWTKGYIQSLRGPGLVMLLILLAEQSSELNPVWFSTDQFPDRYGVSPSTRSKGTQELEFHHLLVVEKESVAANPRNNYWDPKAYRNLYRLTSLATSLD
ncbi:hypothetical protein R3P82_17575 [Dietzia maris]|uniref:Helix-turn-helix domain-containing protein n=1 Tax=Dietzia maris TaxID=37915 RepID=A0AAE4R4P1_9ACTN|nr:hypothetical protein [Dietzia maris]MDV6300921.1 hypothetical protein [Dietzia maris]